MTQTAQRDPMADIDPVLRRDWHPVCRGDSLHAGERVQKVELLGLAVWLKRNAAGVVLAWSEAVNDRDTRAHPALERYGVVWVCLGEPVDDVPPFPEYGQPGFISALCGPFGGINAAGTRLIENYIDAAHFPFVHGGVLGDAAYPELGDYEAHITPDGVVSDPIWVYQPDPFAGAPGRVTYTYHVYRPLTAHFTKHMPAPLAAPGTPMPQNGMLLTITPHTQRRSSAWFIVATNGRASLDAAAFEAEYTPRIGAIFEQDRRIVESQRPEHLPLDLHAELHLKSDRVAIAYRRWLTELGMRWGVA